MSGWPAHDHSCAICCQDTCNKRPRGLSLAFRRGHLVERWAAAAGDRRDTCAPGRAASKAGGEATDNSEASAQRARMELGPRKEVSPWRSVNGPMDGWFPLFIYLHHTIGIVISTTTTTTTTTTVSALVRRLAVSSTGPGVRQEGPSPHHHHPSSSRDNGLWGQSRLENCDRKDTTFSNEAITSCPLRLVSVYQR